MCLIFFYFVLAQYSSIVAIYCAQFKPGWPSSSNQWHCRVPFPRLQRDRWRGKVLNNSHFRDGCGSYISNLIIVGLQFLLFHSDSTTTMVYLASWTGFTGRMSTSGNQNSSKDTRPFLESNHSTRSFLTTQNKAIINKSVITEKMKTMQRMLSNYSTVNKAWSVRCWKFMF